MFYISQDDSECNILHIDMDCFFASCEEKMNPHIVGQPVIVGGISQRGVVAAANYKAREFGIHSGMSIKHAMSLCPKGIFLSSRINVYKKISDSVFRIFYKYTDKVEAISIDEAFLDVSSQVKFLGSPFQIAQMIREEIRDELDLVASVGVAENMFLAKIASGRAKPDGMFLVPKAYSLNFLHELPISVIWGLGAKNQSVLRGKGYEKVGDLSGVSLERLSILLGPALGMKVFELSRGIDRRKVGETVHEKSFSNEITFKDDVYDFQFLRNEILSLSKKCAFSLRSNGYFAKTVSVKMKFADFSTVTRDKTFYVPTVNDEEIFNVAMLLLEKLDYRRGVRLLGVKVANLIDEKQGIVQTLFDDVDNVDSDKAERNDRVLKASDILREKYGDGIIMPASLINRFDK